MPEEKSSAPQEDWSRGFGERLFDVFNLMTEVLPEGLRKNGVPYDVQFALGLITTGNKAVFNIIASGMSSPISYAFVAGECDSKDGIHFNYFVRPLRPFYAMDHTSSVPEVTQGYILDNQDQDRVWAEIWAGELAGNYINDAGKNIYAAADDQRLPTVSLMSS